MTGDIDTRLGRIEGSLDMYTRTLTGVIDRMEKRQTLMDAAITDVKVDNAKRTGMMVMLTSSLSAMVAVGITFFKGQ
jgi:hypothetical protein